MSIPLTVNGITFQYPQQFDRNWGPTLTNWSSAVTTVLAGVSSGSFLVVKSQEANIAQTGFLRVGNSSPGIVWRNVTNTGDLALTVDASNQLTFNGSVIGATTTLTNGHIYVGNVSNLPIDVAMTGDVTISNTGVTAIGAGKVLNAQIGASAAITFSKLAATSPYFWFVGDSSGVLVPVGVTASRVVITDAVGLPSASSVTPTELAYLSGATSSVQTQLTDKLDLAGGTMSGNISMASNKITSLASGTTAGDAATFAQATSGKIVQIVTGTQHFHDTTTSTVFTTTSLTATIIPSLASSTILIDVTGTADLNPGATNRVASYTVKRDATELSGQTNGFMTVRNFSDAANTASSCLAIAIKDAPATTSAVTYTLYLRTSNSDSTAGFGDVDAIATIRLIEVTA